MSGVSNPPPRATPLSCKSGLIFMPYSVFRRGTLPFAALSTLTPRRTWAILDDHERARKARAQCVQSLLAHLYALVPGIGAPERAALLALQRDLYNNRPSSHAAVATASRHLRDPEAALLAEIESDLQRESTDREGLRRLLTAELQEARQAIARLALLPDVRDGIQLSGMWLNRAVATYIHDIARTQGNPQHSGTVERSLTSILYRVALKPSPFGSFTEIGVSGWTPARPVGMDVSGRRRVARLSRMLLIWLECELQRVEECREHLPLHPNNTVFRNAEHVEYLTRGADGTEQMLGGERVIRIRRTSFVDSVLDEAQREGATRATVTTRLARAGTGLANTDASVRDAVERLVQVGLLERSLGIPDQEPRYARRMSAALRAVPGATARLCQEALNTLSEVEDDFPRADAARREELLAKVQAQLDRMTTAVGAPRLNLATVRSAIFEDVGATNPAATWRPAQLERNRHYFELLQRLLPLFDEMTLEGLGAFELFRHVFGNESRGVNLLDFYFRFARLDRRTVSAYMSGRGTQTGRAVLRLRRRFFDQILAQSQASPSGEMSAEWVSDFVETFPSHVPPWDSATYRIQFLGDGDGDGIVINGVTTGFGAGFSRFCDAVDADASPSSLQAALRSSAQDNTQGDRQADLVAVLGMNYNLHPLIAGIEIEYPRCRASAAGSDVLSLRDLTVVPDDDRCRLVLVSAHDELPLRFVPLNFLFPAAAPSLYRFLCSLSAMIAYRVGLWERFEARDESLGPRCYPRLTLGPLVVERRTWRVPSRHLPPLPRGTDALGLLLDAQAWRRKLELPETGFVKLFQPLPTGREVDWVEETRRWAISARRGRRHKPQFVDFRNPFLTSVLWASLPTVDDWSLLVQECLPSAATYLDHVGPGSAEEFLVEVRRPTGGGP
jgi:Lantibiotic dehydratase, N terminus